MTIVKLREGEIFIKLSQALKKEGLAESGAEAKMFIRAGKVRVNGESEERPGKKLVKGDIFSFNGNDYEIGAADVY